MPTDLTRTPGVVKVEEIFPAPKVVTELAAVSFQHGSGISRITIGLGTLEALDRSIDSLVIVDRSKRSEAHCIDMKFMARDNL